MTTGDFDIKEYFADQQAEIAKRKGRNPHRRPTEVTVELPVVTHRSSGAFEVRGRGNPDACLTGPRPQNPADVVERKEEKGK